MTLHQSLQSLFPLADPNDSIHKIDDIKNILYGPRAFTVYKAAFSRDLSKSVTIPAFDFLAQELLDYMNKTTVETQETYDEWHHNICIEFLNKLNETSPRQKSYGKAQKCLNMAMKYLYCCNDAPSVFAYKKFDYCHMALDGYTYNAPQTQYPLSFYRDYVHFWAYGNEPKGLYSWSNLEHSKYTNTNKFIRDKIECFPRTFNDYLNACKSEGLFTSVNPISDLDIRPLTPFEAEFFIWEMCKSNKRAAMNQLF